MLVGISSFFLRKKKRRGLTKNDGACENDFFGGRKINIEITR